jgi:hypothetical protein
MSFRVFYPKMLSTTCRTIFCQIALAWLSGHTSSDSNTTVLTSGRILRKGTGLKSKKPAYQYIWRAGLRILRSLGGYSCLFTRTFRPARKSPGGQQLCVLEENLIASDRTAIIIFCQVLFLLIAFTLTRKRIWFMVQIVMLIDCQRLLQQIFPSCPCTHNSSLASGGRKNT